MTTTLLQAGCVDLARTNGVASVDDEDISDHRILWTATGQPGKVIFEVLHHPFEVRQALSKSLDLRLHGHCSCHEAVIGSTPDRSKSAQEPPPARPFVTRCSGRSEAR